jgi:hypothetical protein
MLQIFLDKWQDVDVLHELLVACLLCHVTHATGCPKGHDQD